MIDREDIIGMAIDAGLDCYANNANKKMGEPLDEMESNYVNKLALFASFVYQYAYAKRDQEALTKNIVANWPYDKWIGLTDEEIEPAAEQADNYAAFHSGVRFATARLKEKNNG